MNSIPQSEMLAVLLNLVGPDATKAALDGVPADTSRQVKATLDEFKKHPPTQDEVEYVVDDFVKYFRFAMNAVDQELKKSSDPDASGSLEENGESEAPKILQEAEDGFDVELEAIRKFLPIKLTGDHANDLNRMHPYQVAHAIQNEDTATISLVIRNLATTHAAKTLEFLPDSLRPAVFLELAQPSKVTSVILQKILGTTVTIALNVEQREIIPDAAEQMVTLIRSVPKSIRVPMLEELQKKDEELSERVKSQMYKFEDLSLLADRDLQQVLGQSNTDSLVLALQGADEDLIERILGNMSKRARESLQEEMSFKTNVKQDEIESGRADIAKVITQMDESGAISLE
jgi:flagellar motor switch protein FliG